MFGLKLDNVPVEAIAHILSTGLDISLGHEKSKLICETYTRATMISFSQSMLIGAVPLCILSIFKITDQTLQCYKLLPVYIRWNSCYENLCIFSLLQRASWTYYLTVGSVVVQPCISEELGTSGTSIADFTNNLWIWKETDQMIPAHSRINDRFNSCHHSGSYMITCTFRVKCFLLSLVKPVL